MKDRKRQRENRKVKHHEEMPTGILDKENGAQVGVTDDAITFDKYHQSLFPSRHGVPQKYHMAHE